MTDWNIANPRQVILVSSRAHVATRFSPDKSLKDNIFALTWHMPVSMSPFLYAISVSKERYSYKLIKESGVFAVNFMPHKFKDAIIECGTKTGEHIDKFKEAGLTKEECKRIDCVCIKEALNVFECSVVNEIEAGDHVIIIGEIINIIKNKQGKRSFQIEGLKFTTTGE